jgi:uncharacterized protein
MKHVFRSVGLYYAIACGWAWLAWFPLVLGADGLKLIRIHPSIPVFTCIGTFGPLLASFIVHRIEFGNWRAVRLLPRTRAQWLWVLIGPLLVFGSLFVIFPALISRGGPAGWHWHAAVLRGLWLPMFNYNLFGGPLFEEFGWRGFLQTRLQKAMTPWIAAICVGTLWAAWHVPLFLVHWSSASPLTYGLIVIGLSILMACAFNASGQSVVIAILMHSSFNASSRFLGPFLDDTPTREHPSGELLIAFAFLITASFLIVLTRGRLRIQQSTDPF